MKFILIFALFSVCHAFEFSGKALDLKSQNWLYSEKHNIIEDSEGYTQLVTTEYLRPDGTVFAKMKSDFSDDKYIPHSVFEDLRFKTKDELSYDKSLKQITVVHTGKNNKIKKHVFPLKENMLAGQGFHNFLITHFESLKDGKKIPVQFIVLAKADHFQFDITQKNLNENTITLGLNVHNFFLKFFVSEIETDYSIKTKRLKAFRGLSNITDDQDKPIRVSISYEDPRP